MAQKEEAKPDSQDIFGPYREEIRTLQRQLKGAKGQIALLNKKQASSGSNQAIPSSDNLGLSEIKLPEAPHFIHKFEKYCVKPGCGGEENPDYVKPNIKCSKCGVPEGTLNDEEIKTLKAGGEAGPDKCWSCGHTGLALIGQD